MANQREHFDHRIEVGGGAVLASVDTMHRDGSQMGTLPHPIEQRPWASFSSQRGQRYCRKKCVEAGCSWSVVLAARLGTHVSLSA